MYDYGHWNSYKDSHRRSIRRHIRVHHRLDRRAVPEIQPGPFKRLARANGPEWRQDGRAAGRYQLRRRHIIGHSLGVQKALVGILRNFVYIIATKAQTLIYNDNM